MTPARRLLAMLEEERSLETRPLDEILVDLEAHGVDAAGPIKLARRLAVSGASPATALLGAVIEDEAIEAEIAALEAAPIDDVRGQVDIGTVAAVAASATRQGGAQSNVVGLRRRRSTTWAWAGSLVGMAACVLIVVAAWWPPSELMSPSPEIASIEVRPARPDDSAGAPLATMEAARPESETSLSSQGGQALGRMTLEPGSPEGEADGVGHDREAAPASPASEERSQVPEVASRIADPAEPSASASTSTSSGAGAPNPVIVLNRQAPAPVAADRAPVRADMPQPEVLGEAVDSPVPPLPTAKPGDGRLLADESIAGPAIENAAPDQAGPPAEVGEPAMSEGQSGDFARSLSVVPEAGTQFLRNTNLRMIAVDGVVFPLPFGIGAGENWSDGAYPVIFHDQLASFRHPAIGLVPDPPLSMTFGGGGRSREEDGRVLIDPGGAAGSVSLPGTVQAEPSSLLAALSRGLGTIVRDGQAMGTDPWSGPWTGGVADRLADARALADGGTVLALLTIRGVDDEMDVALLAAEGDDSADANLRLKPLLRRWFGDDAARFRLIVLPPR